MAFLLYRKLRGQASPPPGKTETAAPSSLTQYVAQVDAVREEGLELVSLFEKGETSRQGLTKATDWFERVYDVIYVQPATVTVGELLLSEWLSSLPVVGMEGEVKNLGVEARHAAAHLFMIRQISRRLITRFGPALLTHMEESLGVLKNDQQRSSPISPETRQRHFMKTDLTPLITLTITQVLGKVLPMQSELCFNEAEELEVMERHIRTCTSSIPGCPRLVSAFRSDAPSFVEKSGVTVPKMKRDVADARQVILSTLTGLFESIINVLELLDETDDPERLAWRRSFIQEIYTQSDKGRAFLLILRQHCRSNQDRLDFFNPLHDALRLVGILAELNLDCDSTMDYLSSRLMTSNPPSPSVPPTSIDIPSTLLADPELITDLLTFFSEVDSEIHENRRRSETEERQRVVSMLKSLRHRSLFVLVCSLRQSKHLRSIFVARSGLESFLAVLFETVQITETRFINLRKNIETYVQATLSKRPCQFTESELLRNLDALIVPDPATRVALEGCLLLCDDLSGQRYLQSSTETSQGVIDLTARCIFLLSELSRWKMYVSRLKQVARGTSSEGLKSEVCLFEVASPTYIQQPVVRATYDLEMMTGLLLLQRQVAGVLEESDEPGRSLAAAIESFRARVITYETGRVCGSLLAVLCSLRHATTLENDEQPPVLLASELLVAFFTAPSADQAIWSRTLAESIAPSVETIMGGSLPLPLWMTSPILDVVLWLSIVASNPHVSNAIRAVVHIIAFRRYEVRQHLMTSFVQSSVEEEDQTKFEHCLVEAERKEPLADFGECRSLSSWASAAIKWLSIPSARSERVMDLIAAMLIGGSPLQSTIRASLCTLRVVESTDSSPVSLLELVMNISKYAVNSQDTKLFQQTLECLLSWTSAIRSLPPLDKTSEYTAAGMLGDRPRQRRVLRTPLSVWESLHFEKVLMTERFGAEWIEACITWATEDGILPLELQQMAAFLVVGILGRCLQVSELLEFSPPSELLEIFNLEEASMFSATLARVSACLGSGVAARLLTAAGEFQRQLMGRKNGHVPSAAPTSLLIATTIHAEVVKEYEVAVECSMQSQSRAQTNSVATILPTNNWSEFVFLYKLQTQSSFQCLELQACLHHRAAFMQRLIQQVAFALHSSPPQGGPEVPESHEAIGVLLQAISGLNSRLDNLMAAHTDTSSQSVLHDELNEYSKEELISIIGYLLSRLESQQRPIDEVSTDLIESSPLIKQSHTEMACQQDRMMSDQHSSMMMSAHQPLMMMPGQPHLTMPGQQPSMTMPGQQPPLVTSGQPHLTMPGQQPSMMMPGQQPPLVTSGQPHLTMPGQPHLTMPGQQPPLVTSGQPRLTMPGQQSSMMPSQAPALQHSLMPSKEPLPMAPSMQSAQSLISQQQPSLIMQPMMMSSQPSSTQPAQEHSTMPSEEPSSMAPPMQSAQDLITHQRAVQAPIMMSAQPPLTMPAQTPVIMPAQAPLTMSAQPPMTIPAQPPMTMSPQPPMMMPAQAPVTMSAQPPLTMPAQAPVTMPAQAPVTMPAQAPVTMPAQAPVTMPAQAPVTMPAQAPVTMPAQESALQHSTRPNEESIPPPMQAKSDQRMCVEEYMTKPVEEYMKKAAEVCTIEDDEEGKGFLEEFLLG